MFAIFVIWNFNSRSALKFISVLLMILKHNALHCSMYCIGHYQLFVLFIIALSIYPIPSISFKIKYGFEEIPYFVLFYDNRYPNKFSNRKVKNHERRKKIRQSALVYFLAKGANQFDEFLN